MSYVYVVIPRIEIENANALSGGFFISAAPVSASVLFAHAMGRDLDEPVEGVAILHHHALFHGDKLYNTLHPQQRRAASLINKDDHSKPPPGDGMSVLSMQPSAQMNLTISLTIQFDEYAEISMEDIEKFLFGRKFMGGSIISHNPIKITEQIDDVRSHLGNGFWVIDRSDLLRAGTQKIDKQFIDAFGNTDKENTWLSAATLGYSQISPAEDKPFSRNSFPHSYSEPVIGIIQYASRRMYLKKQLPLWRYSWPETGLFLMQQN